jgi:hypothetical protein
VHIKVLHGLKLTERDLSKDSASCICYNAKTNSESKEKNERWVLVLLDMRGKHKNRPHAIGDKTKQST